MRIAVIGGGAAGFFAAIQTKLHNPSAEVIIFEKSNKLLAKVKISGGGRCNVTNVESDLTTLSNCYPRGGRLLKKAFREFSTTDTRAFFEERGVPLVVQEDGCIFPASQNSESIINCFLNESKRLNIEVKLQQKISSLVPKEDNSFTLVSNDYSYNFHKVIVCTGGAPNLSSFNWLSELGQPIVSPVPSLFTFNMPQESIKTLQGTVVNPVITKIKGTKFTANGPLLVTHWGMSGPAVLVLSAFGARWLQEQNYTCSLLVNWTGKQNEEEVRQELKKLQLESGNTKLKKFGILNLTQRLWEFLLIRWGVDPEIKWNELGKKGLNKIINGLTNDEYQVKGKTTFKEEFVTAGGVDLKMINFKNMESKVIPNLHFAGEILDIDGITGGFNFQSAWTTAYLAGK